METGYCKFTVTGFFFIMYKHPFNSCMAVFWQ